MIHLEVVQDVLKLSQKRLQDFFKMCSRFLEDVLKNSCRHLNKTSWRRFENVLKTSWRHMAKAIILILIKTSWIHLEILLWRQRQKTSWRRLYHNKCLLVGPRNWTLCWKFPVWKKNLFLIWIKRVESNFWIKGTRPPPALLDCASALLSNKGALYASEAPFCKNFLIQFFHSK